MLPALRQAGQRSRWLLIATIFLCSTWIREAFPVVVIAAPHDDFLFITVADSLLQGRWLGAYNQLTHAKGVAYPVFLALNHLTGLPLKLTEHLLYLGSALFFCLALGRVFASRWLTVMAFALMAFIPAPWSPVVGGRVVREGLYVSLVLLLQALAMRCYVEWNGAPVAQELRQKKFSLISLGLLGGVFWLTREEGVWILPSMAILVGYWIWTRARQAWSSRAAAMYLGLPLVLALVPVHAVNSLNYLHYGVFRNNDFDSPDFVGAYGALSRIRHAEWRRYVVFPKDARERAYRFSPAARELEPYFEGDLGRAWRAIGCEQTRTDPCPEILSGWFMWALRDAVQAAGHYESAPKAAAFYRRLASEIDRACERSPGDCLPQRETLAPPWRTHYVKDTLMASGRIAATLLNLDGLPLAPGEGFGTPGQLATFARITHEPVAGSHAAQDTPGVGLRQGLARRLAHAERAILRIGLPLSLFLLASWVVLAMRSRKLHAGLVIAVALGTAVTTRVLLLGFLDATSIPSNNMLYLSPAVPLALALVLAAFRGFRDACRPYWCGPRAWQASA